MRLLILIEIVFFTAAEKERLRKSHEILAQGEIKNAKNGFKNSSI